MEVVLRDCPHCGQVLIDDMEVCPGCGKETTVPVAAVPAADLNVTVCPKCGVDVPRGVLRCRDCGAYVAESFAAAAQAKSLASARSVLNDLDDVRLQLIEEETPSSASDDDDDFVTETPMTASEDDFEYTDYTTEQQDEYSIGGSQADQQASYEQPAYDQGYEEPAEYTPQEEAAYEQSTDYETQEVPGFEQPAEEPAAEEPAAEVPTEPETPAVSHSVATGGDALLNAALQEETETQKRRARGGRKTRKAKDLPPGSFIVYCPQGCRIVVQDKHRGRTGRCPKCKSLFFVPPALVAEATGEAAAGAATAASTGSKYSTWIQDVRIHRVNPAKLKLKPDSLLNEFEPADVGFHPEHLLLVTTYAGAGMFRAFDEKKKKAAVREKVAEHLATAGTTEGLPAPKFSVLGTDQLMQAKVVQPSIPGEESLFADVPVFGNGRIAVRLPAADTPTEKGYVSFTLSQFRAVSEKAEELGATHLADAARSAGVPLTDEFTEYTCHYSEARMNALDDIRYHQADPAMPLVLLGWKCAGCGLIISEDARKKEKVGGKSEASVPKAKCPKCKKPMGNNRLMGLKGAPAG